MLMVQFLWQCTHLPAGGWLLICLARLRRKFCALLEHFSCHRVSSVFCPRFGVGMFGMGMGRGIGGGGMDGDGYRWKDWMLLRMRRMAVSLLRFCFVVTGIVN